jgi:hypothetical protein
MSETEAQVAARVAEIQRLLAELDTLPDPPPALPPLRDGLQTDLARTAGTAARFVNTGPVAEGP